ncbi:MAG: hypothetical protein ACKVOE_03455 [Rickettsiales bacterium]
MTDHFPFHRQKHLPPITQAELDAFNMERFQFADEQLPAGKAVGSSTFEAIREASLKLLEAAMGERRVELPKISEEVLKRYAGNDTGTIW